MFESSRKVNEIHEVYLKHNPIVEESPDGSGKSLPTKDERDELLRSFIEASGSNYTLSVVVTTNCSLRCGHCPIGIYGAPRDVPLPALSKEDIRRAIRAAAKHGYNHVNFVGGEPMLAIDRIAAGLEECHAHGIKGFIVTAPIWAKTREIAKRKLAKLGGLDFILLSYDNFHNEFLKPEHYDNAIDAANELGINITMNVCYALPEEKEQLEKEISRFADRVMGVQYVPYVPLGNPKDFPKQIPFSGVVIDQAADLDRIQRTCNIGSASIGLYKDVFACCWAMANMDSPLRFDRRRSGNFERDFHRLESDPNVKALRKTGMIDSMSDDKKEEIAHLLKGKKFVNECHLCLHMLDKSSGDLWRKYISVKP